VERQKPEDRHWSEAWQQVVTAEEDGSEGEALELGHATADGMVMTVPLSLVKHAMTGDAQSCCGAGSGRQKDRGELWISDEEETGESGR
jgi:hypothetical protein